MPDTSLSPPRQSGIIDPLIKLCLTSVVERATLAHRGEVHVGRAMVRVRSGVIGRCVVLAAVISVAAASATYATNWGSNHAVPGTPAHVCDTSIFSQCVGETNAPPIVFESLSSAHQSAMTFAMTWYQNNTVLYPYISGLPADRTVHVSDISTSNGAWAWGACRAGATYGGSDPYVWCRPSDLKWNTYYEASHFSTTTQKREVACHEVGHLGGLRHSGNSTGSCMYNPATTPGVTSPDSHDVSQLSAHY